MKICLKCKSNFRSDDWKCPACDYMPTSVRGIISHSPEFSSDGAGGFKKESFSKLAKFESKSFWFRARNKLIIWGLLRYKQNPVNFLEVGCGTGYVLKEISNVLPTVKLMGSEIHHEGLRYAVKRVPKAEFMQMDARQTPYYEEFDSIGAFDVLEHIKEDKLVIKQLHAALKPGGILLISVPQHPFLWSKSDEYACHVRRYTNYNLTKVLQGSGFQILKNTSFVFTLLPFMYFSRIRNRKQKNYNPSNEFQINNITNFIFYFFLYFEIIFIKIGINFPLGGSRFVVAKK